MADGAGFTFKNEEGEGQAAGAGIFDTAYALDKARKNEEGEEGWKHEADLGINGAAVGIDSLAMVFDPLGSVIAAGVGWLIEHIGILREPLDQLAGDPDNIKKIVEETLWVEAEKVKGATELAQGGLDKASGWEGAASQKFRDDMENLKSEVDTLYEAVKMFGTHMMNTATAVTATRTLIRDVIAAVIGSLVAGALVAAAAAPFTFGASIAGFGVYAVARVASVMATIASHMARLFGAVSKLMTKIGGTGKATDDIANSLKRYEKRKNRDANRKNNDINKDENFSEDFGKLFNDKDVPKRDGYSTHASLKQDMSTLNRMPDQWLKDHLSPAAYQAVKAPVDAVDPMKGIGGTIGKEINEVAKAASTEDEDKAGTMEKAQEA